jgi:hypothetical protein
MMGRSQRRKGAAGEREFAKLASELLGRSCQRLLGQARDGGGDVPVSPVLFEVKRRHRIAPLRWMEQARKSALDYSRGRVMHGAAVALREDGGDWHVLMSAELFFHLAGPEMNRLCPEEGTP